MIGAEHVDRRRAGDHYRREARGLAGGPRTLTPRASGREPNGRTLWYGAELNPAGRQVWFRITAEAVCRMREKTPLARGERLIDALLAWLEPDRGLKRELNRFEVQVTDDGDTWIELLRW